MNTGFSRDKGQRFETPLLHQNADEVSGKNVEPPGAAACDPCPVARCDDRNPGRERATAGDNIER
jgi:hypothetical protein